MSQTTTIKLNVLLAKTDHLGEPYKANLQDYIHFFTKKQGAFLGEKKTYTAKEGTADAPEQRKNEAVTTTVAEKLQWLTETNREYIDALFSQEATNASGKATAELSVDGVSWGTFSALELLRLKGLLEMKTLEQMYSCIPVRSDAEEWKPTGDPLYSGRSVFESPKLEGIKKSLMKEHYILPDPNVEKAIAAGKALNYSPVMAQKDTIIDLGNYSWQKFSGEYTHQQRAEILRRRTKLLSAVIQALKTANEVEAVESGLKADTIFNYLHDKKS